jgi:Zn-dependent protease with chaperone function
MISEPEIYVLPYDESINAMAVGTSADDAAVILTKGTMKFLDRDELSALLAHEFSHILNEDTKHFTYMSGYLHGLFFFQTQGIKFITKNPRLATVIMGVIIIAVGFVATIFGKILQAAFSRHREWLADASAAQFTRAPLALARVLKKIGGQELPKRISRQRYPEFSHIFLSEPAQNNSEEEESSFKPNFSSHPRLADRIWELDPSWDGWYYDFEKNPVDYLA